MKPRKPLFGVFVFALLVLLFTACHDSRGEEVGPTDGCRWERIPLFVSERPKPRATMVKKPISELLTAKPKKKINKIAPLKDGYRWICDDDPIPATVFDVVAPVPVDVPPEVEPVVPVPTATAEKPNTFAGEPEPAGYAYPPYIYYPPVIYGGGGGYILPCNCIPEPTCDYPPIPSVPEPTTWLLLLVGFSVVFMKRKKPCLCSAKPTPL